MTETKTTPDDGKLAAGSGRRVLVIHNPTAGRRRGKRLNDIIALLRAKGCVVNERKTTQRGDAEEFARSVTAAECDVIVAAGGDGTVNEVVNGMVEVADRPQLAVLPLGTANVLALEIGLDPKDDEQVAETIAAGPVRTVHLGLANGRHFVLMAGAGLDAHVVEGISGALKRRAGKLAYVVEGVRQAFDYDFPALTIRANGQTYEGCMAVACNGRYYGGPFVAAPEARLDSPSLEVCVLPKSGVGGMVRYGLALPMNKLAELPEVQMFSADSITILGPRGAPLQGDGDIVARLPAEVSIARETVQLVVPG
ncbi:MAG TPA: diacylglycerol kinase family protein [Magnetospirillum sp.]|nr:diacylglycerol kinase family protein [Magnetospirillum sp.]